MSCVSYPLEYFFKALCLPVQLHLNGSITLLLQSYLIFLLSLEGINK
jgi:hypothetical protein